MTFNLLLTNRSFDWHIYIFFFFNDTATTEIYTLSLHDALPICGPGRPPPESRSRRPPRPAGVVRSEEHTSELQSPCNLVCRLLLEKKKKKILHKSSCVQRESQ